MLSTGAAVMVVPRNCVGIRLVSCGVPGKVVMVYVQVPMEKQAAVRWRGRFASLNSMNIMGPAAKMQTKRLTPP
ncbi:hypothetical protein SDC9_160385 [bioreactor metagenome]|uniref:Uncharacterized protein n=1 Tax=bioreactor metagenome TaxID=1076179 RepID=A0A645FF85_9ZZZZ